MSIQVVQPRISMLHVEDDPLQVRLMARIIEKATPHIRVTPVGSLAGAVEALNADAYDVCLLDLGLPDSVGLATLRAIQALRPDQPVVVLTGESDPWLALAAMKMGAQDFLVKDRLEWKAVLRATEFAVLRGRHRVLPGTNVSPFEAVQTLPLPLAVADNSGRALWSNPSWQRRTMAPDGERTDAWDWLCQVPDRSWIELPQQEGEQSLHRVRRIPVSPDGETVLVVLVPVTVRATA